MLVVVDMQITFRASEEVMQGVIREIRKSRTKKEWIVILEYDQCGRTATRILKELWHYSRVIRMVKYIDDGSIAVFHAMRRKNIRPKHIKVCGVNTSACISKTVEGLNLLSIPITVLSNACANKDMGNTSNQIKRVSNWCPQITSTTHGHMEEC
jgi:hypothetical protein